MLLIKTKMYKKGDKVFGLDFGKLSEGKAVVLELEITGQETVTPESKDQAPFEAYTYINNGEEGRIAKDFADIKLKVNKQELVDEIKQDCESYIEKCNNSIKGLKESVKLNKSIIKQLDER